MKSRSFALALFASVVAATGAGYAHYRGHQLKTEAGWLMERGSAEAEEYATSLDSTVAEQQLSTLDQRRAVLDHAQLWQRAEMLGILFAVVSAFMSYVLYLFRRLRDQLVDASTPIDQHAA